MIDLLNIRSLSEFQRNTRAHLKRLKKTGKPEVLTVNGQAQIVVQDAASYQKLLDELERARTVETLRERIKEMKTEKGRPARAIFEELAARHGIDLGE